MADKKITELTSITHVSGDDLLMVVNDPLGSPSSNKVSVGNLFANVTPATVHNGAVAFNENVNFGCDAVTSTANAHYISGAGIVTDRLKLNNGGLLGAQISTSNAVNEGISAGTIWYSNTHLYIATDSNTIKRVNLSTF
jgi:hypothetical protein